MNPRVIFTLAKAMPIVLLLVVGVSAAPAKKPPVILHGAGSINLSATGPATFVLRGTASHVGQYTTLGELVFDPGSTDGSLSGVGVAEFIAANGDQLVGVVTWVSDSYGAGHMAFSWRDSVRFTDGTVVHSTGRFTKNRPAGASSDIELTHETLHQDVHGHRVPIAIIAILIGL